MDSLKDIIGAKPHKDSDGTYSPGPAAMRLVVQQKTDYEKHTFPNAYTGGGKKVLVMCTEASRLICSNGDIFKTGNHPVELFVVLLHLENAGFDIELTTLTGAPVPLEEFAIPHEDRDVLAIMDRYADRLANPTPMGDALAELDDEANIALFIPGGQGAILGLPDSDLAADVLQWFIDRDKYIITICHGPAAFLSLTVRDEPFHFKGYEIVLLTDAGDRMLTAAGYLPGEMPWFFGSKLEDRGMKIVNRLPTGAVHLDRKLISGDSPMAAQKLGKFAAATLLEQLAPRS